MSEQRLLQGEISRVECKPLMLEYQRYLNKMFKKNSGKDIDKVKFEFIQPHGENAKDAYLIKVKSKND